MLSNSIKYTPISRNTVKPTYQGNPSANDGSSGQSSSDFSEILKSIRAAGSENSDTKKSFDKYLKNASSGDSFKSLLDIRI
ncbi:MAG: hypothetical protein FWF83_01565 [Clostridiales bacterium]|nr:hypothetical protein [Clostridiales bacterium]